MSKNKPLVGRMVAVRNKMFTTLSKEVLEEYRNNYKVATFHGAISMGSLNAEENARRFNAYDTLVEALRYISLNDASTLDAAKYASAALEKVVQ